MTIAMLMNNVIKATKLQNKVKLYREIEEISIESKEYPQKVKKCI